MDRQFSSRKEMDDELDLSKVSIPINMVIAVIKHHVYQIRYAGRCPHVSANPCSGFSNFVYINDPLSEHISTHGLGNAL